MNYPESVLQWMKERQVETVAEWRNVAKKSPSSFDIRTIVRRRTEMAALFSDPLADERLPLPQEGDDVYLYIDGKMGYEEFQAFQIAKYWKGAVSP